MNLKEAKIQASHFAKDILGPLGRLPMERAVSKHLKFFQELRSDGASWPQITKLLNLVGITRRDGLPLSASQVRACFSRAQIRSDSVVTSQEPLENHNRPARSKPMPSGVDASFITNSKVMEDRAMPNVREKMKRAKKARRDQE